jgi:hypothetical protein
MIPTRATDEQFSRYVSNIMDVYARATVDQEARGRAWYRTAHQLADLLSEGNVQAGAGVLAALSANKSWNLNVRLATNAFETGMPNGHVKDALVKVAKIMAGADPADVLPMSSKTGNFYRAILDPSDPDAVVIDRHAHDVAVGEVFGNEDRGLSNKNRYATLAHAYREAARQLGVLPSTVQAVTWVVQTEARSRRKHV